MLSTGTDIQWRGITGRGRVPGMSVDPLEQEEQEETERVSLDLPRSVVRFLEGFASYRNALNAEQGRDVRKWTRKSTAEAYVVAQVRQVMESMRGAFERHGPLPELDDPKDRPRYEKEMRAYARAVLSAAVSPAKKSR